MWSEAFQKKDIRSLFLQNEPKWPCQSPGQKTPLRQAVSSIDFRKQYKIHLKLEIGTWVSMTNYYCLPCRKVLPSPFLLHLVISSTHLPYCFLSVFRVWILLAKVTWLGDLKEAGEIRVCSILCLLHTDCIKRWLQVVSFWNTPFTNSLWLQFEDRRRGRMALYLDWHMATTMHPTSWSIA